MKKQDNLKLEEKRFIERAKLANNKNLKKAQKEYNKEEDEKDEKEMRRKLIMKKIKSWKWT